MRSSLSGALGNAALVAILVTVQHRSAISMMDGLAALRFDPLIADSAVFMHFIRRPRMADCG